MCALRRREKEGSVPSSSSLLPCQFLSLWFFFFFFIIFFFIFYFSLSLSLLCHFPTTLPFLLLYTLPNPMAQTQQVKDLAAARAKTTFPVIDLTRYIHGSDDKIARRRQL